MLVELLSIAPGLSRGVNFASPSQRNTVSGVSEDDTIDFQNIMEGFGLMPTFTSQETEGSQPETVSHELEEKVIPKVRKFTREKYTEKHF